MTLFLAKLTLLFVLGTTVALLLRHRSAATRHFVWALTLASAVALALAAMTAPSLTVAVPDWRGATPAADATQVVTVRAPLPALVPNADNIAPANVPSLPPLGTLLAVAWLAGVAAILLRLFAGHAAVSRIAREATAADDAEWSALLDETRAHIGVARRVRVLLSAAVAAPFTTGWRAPLVLLPSDAATWPDDRRRAALLHELAHIARNDYPILLAARLACALYWFHPAAWFALRRLRRECEHATDDRAIARGMCAPDYATHLLDVARATRGRGFAGVVAVGMACPSHLETRLRALLDETRTRGTLSRRRVAFSALGAALLLVLLAAARPELRASERESANAAFDTPTPTSTPTAFARVSDREPAKTRERERTVTTSTFERVLDAAPGGTLVLDLDTGGSIDIVGDDDAHVDVRADLRGQDADKTVVDATSDGSGVRVSSTFSRRAGTFSTAHEFVVRVPRRYNVRIHSSGGDVHIVDVEGTFDGSTGGGTIHLERLHGRAELSTGGGDIEVVDSELGGRTATGGGAVRFVHVRGGLRGASGSGPVDQGDGNVSVNGNDDRYGDENDDSVAVAVVPAVPAVPVVSTVESVRDVPNVINIRAPRTESLPRHAKTPGLVEITKGGGIVELDEAPHGAIISTGGGRIRVGRAAGFVDASTGGGRIEVGPVAGSVTASTGSGSVEITLEDAGGEAQTVDVISGHGHVVVELPANFDGRFELETAYTDDADPARIDSPWPLQRAPVTAFDGHEGTPRRYVRAHGVAGSGRGLVRIRTVNGDVTLHRAE
jgi:beta-lactamase regulating signal transducer with metallopeptidase domain